MWLVLLVFATAALFSTKLFEAYSKYVEVPALAAAKPPNVMTSPCRDYTAALPERAPKTCEFVRTLHGAAGEIRETFYFSDGSLFTLESRNGRWRSSGATCTALGRQGWLSGAGVLLLAIAMVSQLVRTRQLFFLPPINMNDFELIVTIIGACLFTGGFIGMALAQCSAMTVPL
jgi:hypothetical protein